MYACELLVIYQKYVITSVLTNIFTDMLSGDLSGVLTLLIVVLTNVRTGICKQHILYHFCRCKMIVTNSFLRTKSLLIPSKTLYRSFTVSRCKPETVWRKNEPKTVKRIEKKVCNQIRKPFREKSLHPKPEIVSRKKKFATATGNQFRTLFATDTGKRNRFKNIHNRNLFSEIDIH